MRATQKVAMVTGAGSGIGAAVAQQISSTGALVVCADLRLETANQTAERIATVGGRAEVEAIDVADERSVNAVLDQIVGRHGRLDQAVNSAGITLGGKELVETDPADWRRVIEVNLTGVFLCMQAQIRAMLAGGGGAVVNLSSSHGLVARPRIPAYIAAKHGVIGITKAAAVEYAQRGVRVNAVCPGYIDTPMVSRVSEAARDELVGLHPIGRLGTADEVADAVSHLLSDQASFITGATVVVDGGYTAL